MIKFVTLFIIATVLAGAGLAQSQPRGGAARSEILPLGAMLNERLAILDRELAAGVIRRAQVPATQVAQVDLEIDLRILQRWIWDQMARTKNLDLQCALYARGLALDQAVAELNGYMATRSGMQPSRTQAEAMVRLHQLTFALEDLEDPAALDTVAQQVGGALLNVVAENPIDARSVPLMRPRNAPVAESKPVEADRDAPPTLPELAQQAQVMTVSPPLRAQLIAVARTAHEASLEPQLQAEAQRLTRLLTEAIELAEGLASNTAVAPEERMGLEAQLTEALALSADRRLKSAGESRMAALRPYRQTLVRVGRLRLTPDQRARLAAALNYAQANPDSADRIFNAIDRHRQIRERFNRLPAEPPSEPQYRRAVDELRRQFEQSGEQFFEVASNLGGGGVFASGPEELANELDRMHRSVELLEVLQRLPIQVQVLAQYRPRPMGGLERRAATAALAVAAPVANGQRANNEKALRAIARLGTLAEELAAQPLSSLEPAEADAYTGGRAQAFDERWRGLIQELATSAASGGDLDSAKLDRVGQFKRVVDGVREGIELGRGEVNWEALSRWADWTMRPEDFQSMLMPMRQELSGAVQALAAGDAYDFNDFARRRDRYAPIIAFVRKANSQAEALQQLPRGMMGSCAKLLTPMAGSQGSTERFAGLATRLWVYQDAEASQQILAALGRRLAPEVGMRYREDRRR